MPAFHQKLSISLTFTNVIATFQEKTLFHFKVFLVALSRFLRFDIFLLGKYKSQEVPGELGVAKGALRMALESSLGVSGELRRSLGAPWTEAPRTEQSGGSTDDLGWGGRPRSMATTTTTTTTTTITNDHLT